MSGHGAGAVLHRFCAACDLEVEHADTTETCPRCGGRLVEIRSTPDELIGALIDGRFEIRALLGEGGMGAVYRAWQRSVGREVAIKVMDRRFSRDAMGVKRFLREARLASQLSQPNTVSIFDFGQSSDGRLFIAMELIRGRTLFDVATADGPFSATRAGRVGIQICDALDAAHALKIIHRDLKLENVIVLDHPPGRDLIKVLDFGLAKSLDDDGSHGTQSGVVVGTPRYMAPEAAMNGTALRAGDLYALGVILGELVTGAPLWAADGLPALIAGKLDPSAAIAAVPMPLRPLVGELIDPDPGRRPTAAQARERLHEIVDRAGPVPSASSERRVSPLAATVEMPTPTPRPLAGADLIATREMFASDVPVILAAASQGGSLIDVPIEVVTASAAMDAQPSLELVPPSTAPPSSAPSPSQVTTVPGRGPLAARLPGELRAPASAPATPALPASSSAAVERSRSRGWLVVAGLAVAATAAIVIVALGDRDDPVVRAPRGSAGSISIAPSPPPSPSPPPLSSSSGPPAASPVPAPAPTPSPSPPPATPTSTVILHIHTRPAGASISIDGHAVGVEPLDIPVARGSAAITITARLGNRTATRTLVPDRARDLDLNLVAPRAHTSDDSTPF
jgi:eukaryotic-like serine/threonine-protein kinase